MRWAVLRAAAAAALLRFFFSFCFLLLASPTGPLLRLSGEEKVPEAGEKEGRKRQRGVEDEVVRRLARLRAGGPDAVQRLLPGNLLLGACDSAGNMALEYTGCWEFRIPGPKEGRRGAKGAQAEQAFSLSLAAWAMKRCDGWETVGRTGKGGHSGRGGFSRPSGRQIGSASAREDPGLGELCHTLGINKRVYSGSPMAKTAGNATKTRRRVGGPGGQVGGRAAVLHDFSGGPALRMVAGREGDRVWWSLDVTRNQPLDRQAAGISPSPIPQRCCCCCCRSAVRSSGAS